MITYLPHFHFTLSFIQQLENILYNDLGVLKVADFGLSCVFQPGAVVFGIRGTPGYMAPELHCPEGYNGPAVDVWALGVVLHLLIDQYFPYSWKTIKVSVPS